MYHCHIFHSGLFVHSFISALPACFCLLPSSSTTTSSSSSSSSSSPPVSLLLFFLSTEQRHVDMRPACTATRERVSGAFDQLQDQTCPQLPRVHSSDWSCSIMGRHRQPKMHTHTCSLHRSYKHKHTHTHPLQRACVPCVGSSHSGVACLLDTREREGDGVCDFPFLALFFFAFDSKMDDCNHRSHQWDRVEVYGAARHSHGKPAVRLLRRAAMGTLCCLFVWGFCCFICIFPLSAPPPPPFDVQNMKAFQWNMCKAEREKESVYVSQHGKPTVSQYVSSNQYKCDRFHSD